MLRNKLCSRRCSTGSEVTSNCLGDRVSGDGLPCLLRFKVFASDAPKTDQAITRQFLRSKSCERRATTGFIQRLSQSNLKGNAISDGILMRKAN